MFTPSTLALAHDYLDLGVALLTFVALAWKGRAALRLARQFTEAMKLSWHRLTGTAHLADRLDDFQRELAVHQRMSTASLLAAQELTRETLKEVKALRAEFEVNGHGSLKDIVLATSAALRARDDHEARPLFWTDHAGACTYVNRAYRQLVGRETNELTGQAWKVVIHPDDRERIATAWHLAVEEDRDFDEFYQIVTPESLSVRVNGRANRVRATTRRDGQLVYRTTAYRGELLVLD